MGRSLDLLVRVVIIAIALAAAVQLVPGVRFVGEWWQLVAVAVIFGLVNAYLRPIVKLLSLPLTFVTLGLIGLVINTGLVLLVAGLSGQFGLGFKLAGWPPGPIDLDVLIAAFLTALVVSIVSTVLALMRVVVPRI